MTDAIGAASLTFLLAFCLHSFDLYLSVRSWKRLWHSSADGYVFVQSSIAAAAALILVQTTTWSLLVIAPMCAVGGLALLRSVSGFRIGDNRFSNLPDRIERWRSEIVTEIEEMKAEETLAATLAIADELVRVLKKDELESEASRIAIALLLSPQETIAGIYKAPGDKSANLAMWIALEAPLRARALLVERRTEIPPPSGPSGALPTPKDK